MDDGEEETMVWSFCPETFRVVPVCPGNAIGLKIYATEKAARMAAWNYRQAACRRLWEEEGTEEEGQEPEPEPEPETPRIAIYYGSTPIE